MMGAKQRRSERVEHGSFEFPLGTRLKFMINPCLNSFFAFCLRRQTQWVFLPGLKIHDRHNRSLQICKIFTRCFKLDMRLLFVFPMLLSRSSLYDLNQKNCVCFDFRVKALQYILCMLIVQNRLLSLTYLCFYSLWVHGIVISFINRSRTQVIYSAKIGK